MPRTPTPPARQEPPSERGVHPMIRAARYTGAGLEFAASVALLAWLGSIADARWATTPWLTVVGAFLGIAGGTWLLVRPFLGPPREEGDGER